MRTVATQRGDHSDIDVTYGRLATWVGAHGFQVGGRVCETYVVGSRETPGLARGRRPTPRNGGPRSAGRCRSG